MTQLQLTVNYNIPNEYSNVNEYTNGIFTFYSNDITKINKIKDLLYLYFLKNISCCGEYYLCICENFSNPNFTLFNSDSTKQKCEYCQCNCQNTSCLQYLKRIDDKCNICNDLFDRDNGWLLDRKNDYIFLIDVYDFRQTGCELPFRFSDIENGNLQKEFNKSFNKKYIKEIPTITSQIIHNHSNNKEHIIFKSKELNKEYKINFDTFISIKDLDDII